MDQQTFIWVAVGVAVLLVAALVITMAARRTRSQTLKQKFGPEYDRAVRTRGRSKAERDLIERHEHVKQLDIRPLTLAESDSFRSEWDRIQARFVDRPQSAVIEADELIGEIMTTRGYPVADFETRAAEISVKYPNLVENYRAAHGVAVAHERGVSSTEDLRQAMVRYRVIFDQLISEVETRHDDRREVRDSGLRDERMRDERIRDERLREERMRDERARAARPPIDDDVDRRGRF